MSSLPPRDPDEETDGFEPLWLRPCSRCGQIHEKCAGHTSTGRPCGRVAVPGMHVCRSHGASTERAVRAAKRRLAIVSAAEDTMLGGSLDVDPAEAMLAMVREAAWNVAALRQMVQQLEPGVAGLEEIALSSQGKIAMRVDPENWRAEPHVLVRMYNEERDRLMRWAKLCREAGVEERLVQVAEQQGVWLSDSIAYIINELRLTPAQLARVPELISGIIEASATEKKT